MTQAAFVRITSQPAFGGQSKSIAEVAGVLRHILAHSGHRLVPLDFAFTTSAVDCKVEDAIVDADVLPQEDATANDDWKGGLDLQ